ncbi:hypothetical protein PIB30_101513 [Stylosanthes scabra]|uniref:Uncharacterized protein n=1 Tax=Stylosanthes scabra TaxID=79078 RepID=A0ABU6ZW95_9FABA|nr:hypothetical protein [Stylosanthes scabra]
MCRAFNHSLPRKKNLIRRGMMGSSRNLMVFEGKNTRIRKEIERAINGWNEFWNVQGMTKESNESGLMAQLKEKWESSPTTMRKINVDATTNGRINGGVGAVARDEMSFSLAAAT